MQTQNAIIAASTGAGAHHNEIVATLSRHAPALLRVARRNSLCADDAHDAYQRAVEIYLRRRGRLDHERVGGWLHTVVKHEAMAVRASRVEGLGVEDARDSEIAAADPSPDERAEWFERLGRTAEALGHLKPQEITALQLLAQGYSYSEISSRTGWSATKVNRALTEGRRALRDRCDEISSGRECARWSAVLGRLADGEATPSELSAVRPHLRQCSACRALVREHHGAPGRVAALFPPLLVLPSANGIASSAGGLLERLHDATIGALHERVTATAHKVAFGLDAMTSGKAIAIAASATALAGGGVAAVQQSAGAQPAQRPRAAASDATHPAAIPAVRPTTLTSYSTLRRNIPTRAGAAHPIRPTRRAAPTDAPAPAAEFGPEPDAPAATRSRALSNAPEQATAAQLPRIATPPSSRPPVHGQAATPTTEFAP